MAEENGLSFITRIQVWLYNYGKLYLNVLVWLLLELVCLYVGAREYLFDDQWISQRKLLGVTFIISRTSAFMIHANTAVLLLPVCRNAITLLRSTFLNNILEFDLNIKFHKLIGWTIFFFSWSHILGHLRNFYIVAKNTPNGPKYFELLVYPGPSWTGWIMIVCLCLICIPGISKFRRKNFNTFWYLHHLFFVYFAMFSIHGAFCLLKPTKPPYCSRGSVFWRYYVFSGVLYLIERVVREIRGASSNTGRVLKVIQHPSRVVEIQFSKDPSIRYKAGQYVFVNCPAVALHEWHPITLTSSPEEDYFSIHVRIVGDWTKRLAEVLGISDIDQKLEPEISNQQVHSKIESFTKNRRMSVGKTLGLQTFYLPRLQIDGPFGSASEDVFKHEVSMLFGAGIGVTPFASILKSIWYRYNFPNRKNKLKKVYFIWTQRETQSFEWFRDLLKAIEDEEDLYYMRTSMGQDDSKTERTLTSGVIHHRYIDIQVYLTAKLSQKQAGNVMINDVEGFQDAITNLRSPTYFGRPNLKKIFTKAAETHPKTNIGVFFCGPKSLDRSIRSAIEDVVQSGKCTAKFTYKKENF